MFESNDSVINGKDGLVSGEGKEGKENVKLVLGEGFKEETNSDISRMFERIILQMAGEEVGRRTMQLAGPI